MKLKKYFLGTATILLYFLGLMAYLAGLWRFFRELPFFKFNSLTFDFSLLTIDQIFSEILYLCYWILVGKFLGRSAMKNSRLYQEILRKESSSFS